MPQQPPSALASDHPTAGLSPQPSLFPNVNPPVGELKYLNRFFWKYRWRMLLGIVFICISNYFQVLQPQVIREALDLVIDYVNSYRVYDGFAVQSEFFGILSHTLMLFAGLVLLLALIMGFFLYLTRQTIIVMSRLIEYDLREKIFDHYEDLSLDFYKRNNTGDLMSRITEDVNKVRMYLGPAVMYMANLVSTIIFVIASMLAVSPTLTLYTLIPLPVLAVSIYYVSNIIHTRSTLIQQQLSKLTSIAQEVFSGIRVVKSYVRERQQVRFFAEQSDTYKDMSVDLAKVDAWFFPLMVFMVGAATILTVYVGGLQVVAGEISAGNIAEFRHLRQYADLAGDRHRLDRQYRAAGRGQSEAYQRVLRYQAYDRRSRSGIPGRIAGGDRLRGRHLRLPRHRHQGHRRTQLYP